MDVQKLPKRPPFTLFGTMRLTGDQKKNFDKNFEKTDFFQFVPNEGTVQENT